MSLASGILIVIGGVLTLGFFGLPCGIGMMGGYYPMMGATYSMMPWAGGWTYAAWVGIASGAVVLLGAIMIFARPRESVVWGVLVLVFSALSFFGMGGFLLGGVLGIVGGILAISGREPIERATGPG